MLTFNNHLEKRKAPLLLLQRFNKWDERSRALTGLGVRVAVALRAAVGGRLLVELVLGEAQGQRVGRAGPICGLVVSEPAVTAAFLGAIWQVERDTALGLQGRNKITWFPLRYQ